MSSEEQLIVTLDAPQLGPARPVGVLTRYGGPRPTVAFEYARSWLQSDEGFELEPRLRLVEGPQYEPGGGMPSILGDTSPDLWGRLLLERREAIAAKQEGRRARRLSDWEFLAGVADETRMGALRLRRGIKGPFVDHRDPAIPPLTGLRALEDAARALFRHLYPLVGRLVRSHLPRRTSPEDLVQTVFMKVFANLDRFSGAVPLEHWVSRIAVNTCLNQLAAERVRPELRWADLSEEQAEALEAAMSGPEDLEPSENLAAREIVEKLLAQLAPAERMLLTLLHLEGRSVAEVQEITGWNVPVIKVRAFRARRKLRKHYEKLMSEKV